MEMGSFSSHLESLIAIHISRDYVLHLYFIQIVQRMRGQLGGRERGFRIMAGLITNTSANPDLIYSRFYCQGNLFHAPV